VVNADLSDRTPVAPVTVAPPARESGEVNRRQENVCFCGRVQAVRNAADERALPVRCLRKFCPRKRLWCDRDSMAWGGTSIRHDLFIKSSTHRGKQRFPVQFSWDRFVLVVHGGSDGFFFSFLRRAWDGLFDLANSMRVFVILIYSSFTAANALPISL